MDNFNMVTFCREICVCVCVNMCCLSVCGFMLQSLHGPNSFLWCMKGNGCVAYKYTNMNYWIVSFQFSYAAESEKDSLYVRK